MVEGVTNGYTKKLEIEGVGYQAQLKKANTVALQVGFANQIVLEAPPGVTRRRPRPDPHHHHGRRQAGGRPVRRRGPQGPPARAVQGQGHPLRGRGRPPQGGQGVRLEVSRRRSIRGRGTQTGAGRPVGIGRPRTLAEDWKGSSGGTSENKCKTRRLRRQRHVRKRLFGTAERPRLAVFRSSKHIYAQVINDDDRRDAGLGQHARRRRPQGPAPTAATSPRPRSSGRLVAERAKQAGIDKICFDRRSYKYHGRVKALADAAREAGLQF